jgi:serine/threonine protein kinase
LLGRWEPSDRSSDSVSHPPSLDRLSEVFPPFLQNPDPLDDDGRRLLSSLRRMKNEPAVPAIPTLVNPAWIPDEIMSGDSSVVKIVMYSESNLIAVKTAQNRDCAELIRRESAILKSLKHPLVLGLRPQNPKRPDNKTSLVTEFAGNGSLASLLAADDQRLLFSPNRIAKVITSTAIAMRFVHSRCVQHRNLTPENILLGWNWTVRIADVVRSASHEAELPNDPKASGYYGYANQRYLAPECYDGNFVHASDVFAFEMILFDLLTGRFAFWENLNRSQTARLGLVEDWRPEIPDSVVPPVRELIAECWSNDPEERPTFAEIVDRLAKMEFKVAADVNSEKVAKFVKRIEERENENGND